MKNTLFFPVSALHTLSLRLYSVSILVFLLTVLLPDYVLPGSQTPYRPTPVLGLRSASQNSVPASEGSHSNTPPELTSLMEQATAAINKGDAPALAELTQQETVSSFAWVARTHTGWKGDVLALPTSGNYLGIFHAWHTLQSEGDHVHLLVPVGQSWRLGAEIPESDPGGFRIQNHDLHVKIDFAHKTAALTDSVAIERTASGTPPFCLLRISEDFHIHKLTLNTAAGPAIPFQQTGGILVFPPPADQTFTLFIDYAGTLNHEDGDYIRANEAFLASYWYPHTARLPATATFTATAPPGWTALAQGELLRQSKAGDGSTTSTYRNDIPTCFFSLDIGRYHVTARQVGRRTLSVYLLTADTSLARRCLDLTATALEYYEAHFGRFPYTRYGIVETRGAFNGALEAYSFATFGPDTLPETIPHELAHTWWGGLIPCPYTRSMWDEAFAEYSDALVQRAQSIRHNAIPSALNAAQRLNRRFALANAFHFISLAEAKDTNDLRQIDVGYEKGKRVLRVLENEIGMDALLHSMAAFAAENPRGQTQDWNGFEQVVDRITGKNYRWFFAEWIEQTGLPRVRLANAATHFQNGRHIVEADIVQQGKPYRFQMPVLLEQSQGNHSLVNIEVSGTVTHLRLETKTRPTRLTLDPEDILPFAPPPDSDGKEDFTVAVFP